jgi:hypothetical protein
MLNGKLQLTISMQGLADNQTEFANNPFSQCLVRYAAYVTFLLQA